ncbi:MAG: MFS transporter [Actinobacteria bacterium]|nr:MFS transporter [Actinomycetota bacterium]
MQTWPRGGLWRHPDFLRLWSAQTVSQLGSQVSQLALPLAAILVLDASAFEVALLGTVEFLPFLLFALPAGVWVDRLRRKPILVLGDLGRAAALASVPVAYAFDALTIWQLYAVGFLVGVGTVFFDVAYQSYLPSLVDRSQLVDGNSKLEVSRSGAALAGPGLAGVLIGAITAPYAILVDAFSFIGSAALIVRIRRPEILPELTEKPSMRRELVEGLRYLLGHRFWRPLAITVALSNFFNTLAFSIFLVYAVRDLELSATVIGIVLGVGNVGWLLGAVAANRLSARLGVGLTLVGSALVFGPALLLVPAAPKSQPIPFLVAALILASFAGIVFNVTGLSFQQAVTPDRLLGRLNATRRFIVWGVIPLGSLTGGALASLIGLRPTLWVGAIGGSLSFLPLLLSPVRSIGDMENAVREHSLVSTMEPDA